MFLKYFVICTLTAIWGLGYSGRSHAYAPHRVDAYPYLPPGYSGVQAATSAQFGGRPHAWVGDGQGTEWANM